jgi:hypothetical protein
MEISSLLPMLERYFAEARGGILKHAIKGNAVTPSRPDKGAVTL